MYWLIVLFPLLLGVFSAWKGMQVYRRSRAPQQPELSPEAWDWLEAQLALCDGHGVWMRRPVARATVSPLPVSRETPKGPTVHQLIAKNPLTTGQPCNCWQCINVHDQPAFIIDNSRSGTPEVDIDD